MRYRSKSKQRTSEVFGQFITENRELREKLELAKKTLQEIAAANPEGARADLIEKAQHALNTISFMEGNND